MKKALLIFILAILCGVQDILAQGCAMCKTSAANLDEASAKGLNAGILYLAAIPILFMGITAYVWYKKMYSKKS